VTRWRLYNKIDTKTIAAVVRCVELPLPAGYAAFEWKREEEYHRGRMSRPLPNYIRSLRRRAVLSQDELAFLIGSASGTSVLRHEDDQRVPALDTALAYSVIFRADVSEVFAGRYETAEDAVRRRARMLITQLLKRPQTAENGRKVFYLAALVNDPAPHYVLCEE
jgi:DNA-binding XRE family transcriptional regulator